jgi:nucleotide-binding universal stress UspA family protein
MFNSIAWATDGSESADRALPYAKSLASADGAALTVIHCEEVLAGRGGGQPVIADEDEMKAKIEKQVRGLKDEGLNASLVVVGAQAGSVPQAIADAADGHSADLIVVGTRGHTRLGGLLLGSVTQRLLHVASCPVFAVPAAAQHPEQSGGDAAHAAAAV